MAMKSSALGKRVYTDTLGTNEIRKTPRLDVEKGTAPISARRRAGGSAGGCLADSGAPTYPGDNMRANGTSQKWIPLRMLPETGSIL